MRVLRFRFLRWSLDRDHCERANLGQDENESGDQICLDPGFVTVRLPVVFPIDFSCFLLKLNTFRSRGIGRFVAAMKESDRVRDAEE